MASKEAAGALKTVAGEMCRENRERFTKRQRLTSRYPTRGAKSPIRPAQVHGECDHVMIGDQVRPIGTCPKDQSDPSDQTDHTDLSESGYSTSKIRSVSISVSSTGIFDQSNWSISSDALHGSGDSIIPNVYAAQPTIASG